MVQIHPFAGVRPAPPQAQAIPSVPYDVVSAEEVREIVRQTPKSFLSVIRSDADLPGVPPDDDSVYALARERFQRLCADGDMVRDSRPGFYVYEVDTRDRTYIGIVACVEAADYESGVIRRHEQTRYDKERDRTRHIGAVNANTGLVFLLYRDPGGIHARLESLAADTSSTTEVVNERGERHRLYRVDDPKTCDLLQAAFADVDALYIADGHHRAKSAVNVALERRRDGTGSPESERFMAVLFAHDRVRLHGYSRLVTDLGALTPDAFVRALRALGTVEPIDGVEARGFHIPLRASPVPGTRTFHMYLTGQWYEIAVPREQNEGLIHSLDVQYLQDRVLGPILGITDPRGDPRLQYLGGARPLSRLIDEVDSGRFSVAFAIQPLPITTVLDCADLGLVMPPKSTWFEPKVLSGFVVHMLD
jgi:uncharacterized protein (DUF1015 family)